MPDMLRLVKNVLCKFELFCLSGSAGAYFKKDFSNLNICKNALSYCGSIQPPEKIIFTNLAFG
jgi:hypothetical protein